MYKGTIAQVHVYNWVQQNKSLCTDKLSREHSTVYTHVYTCVYVYTVYTCIYMYIYTVFPDIDAAAFINFELH